ncbi:MAG TPA: ABC transporter permease [Verrucomicrobiae bacterium]|nr:ABC transporter permease [Verrucomicrobiae bacterium]
MRMLAGPWCVVAAAGVLPLFRDLLGWPRDLLGIIGTLGWFAGVPFLAALSLGGEFQQRTLSLLLGQPVGRLRLWIEKQVVLLVGLAILVPVFWFGWYDRNDLNADALGIVGAWLLVTVASATFWTLLARSTMGGLALGQAVQFILGALIINTGIRVFGPEPSARALHFAELLGILICLGYSGLMLWLGWHQLIHFQATGAAAGEDLLMAGPRLLPRSWAELLRCRATGASLNLLRKELRLLRPLWLITFIFVVCWVCVVGTLALLPKTSEWRLKLQLLPMLMLAFYIPLTAVLAGCLSLGEERSSGTHAWHLTLPVSARQQWLTKLLVALVGGVLCAVVLPAVLLLASQSLTGLPLGPDFKWGIQPINWPVTFATIFLTCMVSLPSFWCACTVKGTVRAALWVIPVMAGLVAVGGLGGWAASKCNATLGALATHWIAALELNPRTLQELTWQWARDLMPFWLATPALVVALLQSRGLFRAEPGEGIRFVLRRWLPLALATFLSGFFVWGSLFATSYQYRSFLMEETYAALARMPLAEKAEKARRLTVADLDAAAPLSPATRHWLSHAYLTVSQSRDAKGRPRPGQFMAQIHFANESIYAFGVRSRLDNEAP